MQEKWKKSSKIARKLSKIARKFDKTDENQENRIKKSAHNWGTISAQQFAISVFYFSKH